MHVLLRIILHEQIFKNEVEHDQGNFNQDTSLGEKSKLNYNPLLHNFSIVI